MAQSDILTTRVRELTAARFKEFEKEVIRQKSLADRAAKFNKEREKRRRDFFSSIGTDLKKLDAATEKDNRAQEAELKEFLAEHRSKVASWPSSRTADAKDAALRSQVLADAGHKVLPVFASSIFAGDISTLSDVGGLDFTGGEINSGWVFPDDPKNIQIKDTRHYDNALCWDNRQDAPPEFGASFGFVPASSGNYEMTAVLAFHGFYVLRCDDSWWNCRDSSVKLTVQMNVNQYSEAGWKSFPALLDVEKDNVEETVRFDRTFFLDYTTALGAGDPVIVTVKGVVLASAHGGGAYAELNFADGTANYIQPLFLSVQQV